MSKTLIVVDNEEIAYGQPQATISFEQYLRDYPKLNEGTTRIINLCDTEHYLSRGYYCSLLAEAREHRVLPSVRTINALRGSDGDVEFRLSRMEANLPAGSDIADGEYPVYFGACALEPLQKLAKRMFQQYSSPALMMTIKNHSGKYHVRLRALSPSDLLGEEKARFDEALDNFTRVVWKTNSTKKARWNMAILVNPEETLPPSDKEAISRFVRAARKLGIAAETIAAEDLQSIANYDALFIRETTAIDHHTYRLAAKAEREGLVVMDDASSILRCCNKVYLQDAFSYHKVPCLKTEVISDASDATLDHLEGVFGYPLVLKMPEGSFSRGVYKVKTREELAEHLTQLFTETALVLAQEFMYTDHDWRIGVLNGRALYACKYFMVRNHWQIYNHGKKRSQSGGFETLPTFEVPKAVLNAALKAAKVAGNGLYGVDIKYRDGNAYVLEVNDNPSLDHNVEDVYLGDELYMQIMSEFLRRLELRGK